MFQKKSIFRWIFSAILFLLLFTTCKNKKKPYIPQVDPQFIHYINAYTSGIISNSDDIVIELNEEQDVKTGEEIQEKLFEFAPDIKGKTYWKNKNTIVFHPNRRLPNGKLYEGRFYLSKITKVPEQLKVFKFNFQTKSQAVDINTQGMQAYQPDKLEWNKLEGVLTTADFADNNQIEKILSATQNGKEKPIRWTHDFDKKQHHFIIDSIYRSDDESRVIIEGDGAPIGADNQMERIVLIPSISNFSIVNYDVQNDPDQMVRIYFSDPVNPKQNLKGLIRFKNKTKLRYLIDGNTVKIYPVKRINEPTEIFISRNIRNTLGRKLKMNYENKIIFVSLKPDIKALNKGNILPDSKGLIFPFKAVNLKAVNVKIIKIFDKNVHQFFQVNKYNGKHELTRVGRIIYKKEVPLTADKPIDYSNWNIFALDLSDMIQVEPGAVYRLEMSFNKKQSLYNCPVIDNENNTDEDDEDESKYDGPSNNYYYHDYDYYYDDDDYYDYDYKNRENPCKQSYYHSNKHKIKRNILASNFGIIAKEGNNHDIDVFISDLLTTDPLSGVSIQIYNYQNQIIGEGITNAEGRTMISLPQKPFLLVAQKNGQYGYLRLDDGSSLSLSMFNVSGRKVQKGVKGYLFADRGVWRPGDSIYLNFILEDKNKQLPENHPVVLEIYNPQNQLFARKVKTQATGNFYDFRFATPREAITGNWQAKVKVGNSHFSKTLKIETIKPNRLKINLKIPNDILHQNDTEIELESKWLHGAPASELKAIVEMKLSRGKTYFKNYKDYHFDDDSKSYYGNTQTLFDGKLDDDGTAKIPLNIEANDAPGMLRANFKTRVFEKGGDFSIDRYNVKYSPYTSYVGVKIPKGKGWHNAIFSDEINLIPVVTLDESGKPVSRNNLKVEIYNISWRWWWQRDTNDDLGYYLQSSKSEKILTDYVSTKNGKGIFKLKFPKKTWGRKFIKITDPVSGHSTGQIFYTDYKSWWNKPGNTMPGGAEMLSFSTDKDTYEAGEKVIIKLPSSKQGRALVSIENGSKVIDAFWTNVNSKQQNISFTVTKEMSPNAYIHITYIQPHAQTENDRPIRLYGIEEISVIDKDSHLEPIITMPDELRPESKVHIKVSEKQGKPMTYSLFVVDEGLLDLTRFKTPNPWNTFYAKEALGVKTYDMYNYVMGAFSGQIAGLLAVGGDEDLIETGNKKANRFKPVVKFLGTFTLNKGESKSHTFTMPNYIGSVRTMVVAGNTNGAYGSGEKTTPVKKPLMVLGTMPRKLSPKEQIKLPVTVFAMDKKIKDVRIKIKTNDLLKIKNDAVKTLHFDNIGEQIQYFDLEVARKVGAAHILIEVNGNGEKATYEMDIPVRIANPEITHINSGVVKPGASAEIEYSPIGISGTNKAVLEISSIPPINLENRLEYLITYPHGCIEQTTSSVFPQLYLNDLMQLSNRRKKQIQDNITAALQRLKQFQLTNGGFSYWPGEGGQANDWGTNYAGHFIIEAQNKGYQLPVGMLNNWIKYQRNRANDWTDINERKYGNRSNQMIQAYRLYTLALAGNPQLGAMNRMREIQNLYPAAKWRLIAAYYLAGKKSIAKEMMANLTTKTEKYIELDYTYGNSDRDEAMILETLLILKEPVKAKKLLDEVSAKLSSERWMSTQTTAFSLLAVSKFVNGQGNGKINCTVNYPKGKKEINTDKVITQITLNFKESGVSKVTIKNQNDKILFTRLINSGLPLESNDLAFNKNLRMNITYFDMNGNPVYINQIKQGTDFIMEVEITHPGTLMSYKNMALTTIFPSGWEITNARMDNISNWESDSFTYQDIRDDRVMTYFDLRKYKTKTYRFMLNASYTGEYYLPSIKCEAMYDNNIINITNGKWVEIVK
jgi:uncharacterized protein YfaS (alpha-2-macroglobulin family)